MAVVASVLSLGAPALAAEPDDIIVELEFRHYAAEAGTSVDVNDLEALVDQVDAVARNLYFVLLASDPVGGNDLFAADLLALQIEGTVVVVSPQEIGASSTDFDDDLLDGAIDEAWDEFESLDDLGAFEAFAEALPSSAGSAEPAESSGGGGFTFLIILFVVVGGIGLLLWRNSKRERAAAEGRLDEAKAELTGQLDVIANEILDLSDRVTVAEHDGALTYFRQANDTYSDVSEAAGTATSLAALEELSDRLDKARWQLEAAEALIEGREVPPEPENRPAHCFFDPAHRAGVEEAEIRTPAGSKMVGVCRDCAAKLRKGETPTPRSINVGGRPVPAPRAPRSYGGGGLDWLGAFSILLGGRDRGVSYDFGRTRRAGGLGSALGRLGTRRTGTSPTRRTGTSPTRRTGSGTTRRSSTSRNSTRRSAAPKVKGRARRRR